jgi:hypothetical protein
MFVISKGLASRWPTEMDEQDLAVCETTLGDYIVTMGYSLKGTPPSAEKS